MNTKRQQYKVTIDDLDLHTAHEIHYCFSCMKPIIEQDSGTRIMSVERGFLQAIKISEEDKTSVIYNEQLKWIKQNACNTIMVCFICEPNVKISMKEYEQGSDVSYFSSFLIYSIRYIRDARFIVDKNFFGKACLCLATTVTAVSDNGLDIVYYHPARDKSFELLEGVIAVLRYTFRRNGSTMRSIPLCMFQVCSILRWKFTGMVTYTEFHKHETHFFRQGRQNIILNDILLELWPDLDESRCSLQNLRVSPNSACAACCYNMHDLDLNVENITYDSCFMLDHVSISNYMKHNAINKQDTAVPFSSVMCFLTLSVAIRSYSYYQSVSAIFPACFSEKNKRRYYDNAIRLHNKNTITGTGISSGNI
jgi:hypothetical protein